MMKFTLKEFIFDIAVLVIVFLLMDYFFKGDGFSWSYQFIKGGIGIAVCAILKRLFFYHQPKINKQ